MNVICVGSEICRILRFTRDHLKKDHFYTRPVSRVVGRSMREMMRVIFARADGRPQEQHPCGAGGADAGAGDRGGRAEPVGSALHACAHLV